MSILLGLKGLFARSARRICNLPRPKSGSTIEMAGDYASFAEAEKYCEGYDGKAIIDKVSQSTMAVLNGKAVYERDGFLFYEKAINYNLLMYLYQCYIEDGFLSVCDWGARWEAPICSTVVCLTG